MAKTELTDRQKQVKDLHDKGKTAVEIADSLKITANAVYQQIRALRALGAIKGGPANSGGAKPKAKAKSKAKAAAATPAPAPVAANVPTTPLQSVRARRSEINAELKASTDQVAAAERALKSAKDADAKVSARHKVELGNLDKAEKALAPPKVKPAKAKAKPKRTASSNGNGNTQSGAGKAQLAAVK